MELVPADTNWRGEPEPPRLVLKDDEGDVVSAVDVKALAAAIAPYLTVSEKP